MTNFGPGTPESKWERANPIDGLAQAQNELISIVGTN
jgi:hypothetical protein